MSLLIILLLFSFQGTLERFTPSKLNNNYYMFVIHKHNVPSCLAPVTQRLAVFMFPPTISQHCPYGLFPLSRRIHSTLYVVKRVTYAFRLSLERRSEEHPSELQSRGHVVCRLLLEKDTTA